VTTLYSISPALVTMLASLRLLHSIILVDL
jgi:hypothetical protein